jgi:hypothetical protein
VQPPYAKHDKVKKIKAKVTLRGKEFNNTFVPTKITNMSICNVRV